MLEGRRQNRDGKKMGFNSANQSATLLPANCYPQPAYHSQDTEQLYYHHRKGPFVALLYPYLLLILPFSIALQPLVCLFPPQILQLQKYCISEIMWYAISGNWLF